MAQRRPWGKAFFYSGAIILLGYGLMKATTPTDEQFYNSLSPELKRRVDEHRNQKARNEQYEKLKASAEAGEVVFQDSASGSLVKASERRR